jgi:uncharacterized protein
MGQDRIQEIETYVIQLMSTVTTPDLKIGHDFKHVDRVRGWVLRIASSEGFEDMELAEATALLHDIGLARVSVKQRSQHGEVGAEIAIQFLREHQLFSEQEIEIIADAIRCHNSPRGGGGTLGEILRDADKLDALGAVGIMRAFTTKYAKPEYPTHDVKGETWEMPIAGFDERISKGKGIGACIIDQINFQISFYEGIHTETAKQLGKPLVEYMKAFVLQLEAEVNTAQMVEQQS